MYFDHLHSSTSRHIYHYIHNYTFQRFKNLRSHWWCLRIPYRSSYSQSYVPRNFTTIAICRLYLVQGALWKMQRGFSFLYKSQLLSTEIHLEENTFTYPAFPNFLCLRTRLTFDFYSQPHRGPPHVSSRLACQVGFILRRK